MRDPRTVLWEYGMPVLDGIGVMMVRNADGCAHITLPSPPDGG